MEHQQLKPQHKKALYKYISFAAIIVLAFHHNCLFSQNQTIKVEATDTLHSNYSISFREYDTIIDIIYSIAPAQMVLKCEILTIDTVAYLFYITNGSQNTRGRVVNIDKYVISSNKLVRESHEAASAYLNGGLLCSTFQIKGQVLVFESSDKSFLKEYNINRHTDIKILINEILNDLKNNVECPK